MKHLIYISPAFLLMACESFAYSEEEYREAGRVVGGTVGHAAGGPGGQLIGEGIGELVGAFLGGIAVQFAGTKGVQKLKAKREQEVREIATKVKENQ